MAKWDNRDNKITKRKKRKQQNQSYDYSFFKKKKKAHVPNDTENMEYKFIRPTGRSETNS